jgi:hypothetical protein
MPLLLTEYLLVCLPIGASASNPGADATMTALPAIAVGVRVAVGSPRRSDDSRLRGDQPAKAITPQAGNHSQVKLSTQLDIARAAERWSAQMPALIE